MLVHDCPSFQLACGLWRSVNEVCDHESEEDSQHFGIIDKCQFSTECEQTLILVRTGKNQIEPLPVCVAHKSA